MCRQGVLGQPKFTCSNSTQIPQECTSCCIRPSFKEISCVFAKPFKTEHSICFPDTPCRGGFQFCRKWLLSVGLRTFIAFIYAHFPIVTWSLFRARCCTHIPQGRRKCMWLGLQCEYHAGVTASQESHSSDGFNIAEVVHTPRWESSN